jgi:hypothetical protein
MIIIDLQFANEGRLLRMSAWTPKGGTALGRRGLSPMLPDVLTDLKEHSVTQAASTFNRMSERDYCEAMQSVSITE